MASVLICWKLRKEHCGSFYMRRGFKNVAGTVRHKTMTGVDGIDVALTLDTHEKLTAIDLARVKALQSGAFVSSWQQAKYDKTKQPICQHCLPTRYTTALAQMSAFCRTEK